MNVTSKITGNLRVISFAYQALFGCLTLFISAMMVVAFLSAPGHLNGNDKAAFTALIRGKAYKPYVTRALVPLATQSLLAVTPDGVKQAVIKAARQGPYISDIFYGMEWKVKYANEYIVAMLLVYASTIGFVYALRLLLQEIFETTKLFLFVVPLAALLCLPVFFKFIYLYDLPQLFLFTLNLYLLSKGRWKTYLVFFILACLNKETSGLLLIVFGIHFFDQRRMTRIKYAWLGGAQIFIIFAVNIALKIVYRDNPGGAVENYLIEHLKFLLVPYSLSFFVSWGILFLSIFAHWNVKPQFLKDALWIGIPLFVSFIPFGFRDEIRVFYELYPIVVGLVAQTIALSLGIPVVTKDALTSYPIADPSLAVDRNGHEKISQ